MFPRTKDFNVLETLARAEAARPAWVALRGFFRVVRGKQEELGKRYRAIDQDKDLTAEARSRRAKEILSEMSEAVETAWRGFLEAHRQAVADLDAAIGRDGTPNPFRPPTVAVNELSASDQVLARLALAQHEQTGRVARLLAEASIERRFDRALEDRSGAALVKLLESVHASGDALVRHVFEGYARSRLDELSEPQRRVFDVAMEGVREAQLSEEARLLSDHRDALNQALQFSEGVRAEAKLEDFLTSGRSIAFQVAPQMLGELATG